MPKYEREFSSFPEKKIELHNYKNITSEVSNIIKEIDKCRKNKDYAKAQELIKENASVLKPYIFDATRYRTLEEEIYNTHVYAKQNPQKVCFGLTGKDCSYNDVWITIENYEPLIPVMTSNLAPYGEVKYGYDVQSTNYAYEAFDGDATTYWMSSNHTDELVVDSQGRTITQGYWLEYNFATPVDVHHIVYLVLNDETTYISSMFSGTVYFDLYDNYGNILETASLEIVAEEYDGYSPTEITFPKLVENVYSVRMSFSNGVCCSTDTIQYARCAELQLYGVPHDVKPVKRLTAQLGEDFTNRLNGFVTYSSQISDNRAYKAINSGSDYWQSATSEDVKWVQYNFFEEVSVQYITYQARITYISNTSYSFYDDTLTFELLDYDGNVIQTATYELLAEHIYMPFRIGFPEIVNGVWSIRVSGMGNYNSTGSATKRAMSCAYLMPFGYTATKDITYTSLIPEMTSNTLPSGEVSDSAGKTNIYRVFNSSNGDNSWDVQDKTTDKTACYLQYEFAEAVGVKYVEFIVTGAGTRYFNDADIFFDLMDADLNVIETLSTTVPSDKIRYKHRIESSELVEGVKFIRCRFGGGFYSTSSSATTKDYVCMSYISAYGIPAEVTE